MGSCDEDVISAEKFTLYVGDLDSNVTQSDLYNKFSEICEVSSVKLCLDRNNGSSLCYAYVNFKDTSHAEMAMKELNFKELKGKAMRIMYLKRDPSSRRSGKGNLFVKNLAESFDNKQLSHLFSSFGRILSCKVACDASGVSKGYGFVQFQSNASAEKAIDRLNGALVRQQRLQVCPFLRRRQWDESPTFTNVYVKNLTETATDADLKMLFEEFGEISSAVVMRDGKGKSRKFGFVNFKNAEAATTAVEKMNGTIIGEKELYVGRAQKKKTRAEDLRAQIQLTRDMRVIKGLNLYVKNLDDSVNEETLRGSFSEFGIITSTKVMVDSNGVSKGVGFVEFSTSEEASKAMKEMDGKTVGTKPIYVSLAQRKEERKSQNVVTSTPRPSPHQHIIASQAAAPVTVVLPQPPAPVRGYNYQPPQFSWPGLLNSVPAGPVPTFMGPYPFSFPGPAPYQYAAPVGFHGGLQPVMSFPLPQPPLWNPYARV